ncbi:MAG: thioredoxin domain-containing protein [Myxococcota bacterium]
MAKRKSKNPAPSTATKSTPSTKSDPSTSMMPKLRARALVGLVIVGTLCALLAVFQWMELLLVHAGQETVCELDDVFNCASVWSAPAAKWWQATTGVPIAGWGLLWGLLALATPLWAMHGYLTQAESERPVAAIQLVAASGVATSVLLGGYSLSLGQICLTCWTTYALVAVYSGLSVTMLDVVRPDRAQWSEYQKAAVVLVAAAFVGYLGLRIPGASTPLPDASAMQTADLKAPDLKAPSSSTRHARGAPSTDAVAEFLRTLTPAVQRRVAEGLEAYRTETRPMLPPLTPRPIIGRVDAPVRITDFSDMRCPHCARLAETMQTLAEQLPSDRFRLESRYFPLDAECNPRLDPRFTDGSHIRCTAAKALVCSQSDPNYEAVRYRLFKEQPNLTLDLVRQLVVEMTSMNAEDLKNCISSPETTAKLKEDIAYAARFDIRGTPMVVMNGREILAFGPLLMAMVLAEGDVSHPGFSMLEALAHSDGASK